jgi:hypothetical protein
MEQNESKLENRNVFLRERKVLTEREREREKSCGGARRWLLIRSSLFLPRFISVSVSPLFLFVLFFDFVGLRF